MIPRRAISKLVEKALEGAETIRTLHSRLLRRYGDDIFLGPAGIDLFRDVVDLARITSNLETMRSNLSQSNVSGLEGVDSSTYSHGESRIN